MNESETMQLEVWSGDWGLPSIDTECLQILAYAKFVGLPVKVVKHDNPYRTPHGHFPVLRDGSTTLDTFPEIVNHLRTKNYGLGHARDECSECGKTSAYEAMLTSSLLPALQFVRWRDVQNMDQLLRPWYSKKMPFLINFYYLGRFEKEAIAFFDGLYPKEEDTNIETKVYADAYECLTMLSSKLKDTEYFFGSMPTEIDAILYSYLAPILYIPFPNAALQSHLKACRNLVEYISRISNKYFTRDFKSYDEHKKTEDTKAMSKSMNDDYPHKRRNQVLAGLFVTAAMASYALSTGIVEVPTTDEQEMTEVLEEYDDSEDYE